MSDADVSVRWAASAQEVQGAVEVRQRVFCGEQRVPVEDELDGRDDEAMHVVAVAADGRVLATTRLLLYGEVAKVSRVAVDREWRRRGIAARMLDLALAEARARGCEQARLAAQLDVVGMYERAGFEVCSDQFEDAGIKHVSMCLALAPAR